jgi:hypothetical protein
MESNRTLTYLEERLLEVLIKKSSVSVPLNWKVGLLAHPMNDGGMGSLYLLPKGKITENRILGEQISDFQFTDVDGIAVIASLYLDSDGDLFELDIWKTDFGKLIKLPNL